MKKGEGDDLRDGKVLTDGDAQAVGTNEVLAAVAASELLAVTADGGALLGRDLDLGGGLLDRGMESGLDDGGLDNLGLSLDGVDDVLGLLLGRGGVRGSLGLLLDGVDFVLGLLDGGLGGSVGGSLDGGGSAVGRLLDGLGRGGAVLVAGGGDSEGGHGGDEERLDEGHFVGGGGLIKKVGGN